MVQEAFDTYWPIIDLAAVAVCAADVGPWTPSLWIARYAKTIRRAMLGSSLKMVYTCMIRGWTRNVAAYQSHCQLNMLETPSTNPSFNKSIPDTEWQAFW